ncbi:hypothetical protein CO641_03765 [Lysobacteraceae bacterium NML91-0213]|nr:hypothetical protein CO641_03765 [Xanthomonadaceae bacterium NML91-0213]
MTATSGPDGTTLYDSVGRYVYLGGDLPLLIHLRHVSPGARFAGLLLLGRAIGAFRPPSDE